MSILPGEILIAVIAVTVIAMIGTIKPLHMKRYLLVAGTCFLAIGSAVAATQIVVNNNSTIGTGKNIFITQFSTTTLTTCPPINDSSYTALPNSASWNLVQGAPAQQQYFCIENAGTSPDTPTVTSNLTPGTCPSAGNSLIFATPTGVPTILAPSAVAGPITISVCAGTGVSVGAGPSFLITVT